MSFINTSLHVFPKLRLLGLLLGLNTVVVLSKMVKYKSLQHCKTDNAVCWWTALKATLTRNNGQHVDL